jgi:prepilin-type N-terminal cleavage/methylation domain-containing protein
MKRKGFTLVELLVVIAIIALLMGILMPALSRVRQIAFRMVCGTNLSGIGKAMLIYANDYEDELPRAGGRSSTWSTPIPDWQALNRFGAYGLGTDGSGGTANISSCFYLLVKYAEVTPKSFICKGDSGAIEFKPSEHGIVDRDLIELWDFGTYVDEADNPSTHCSYAYHVPFGVFALTTSSEPGMAVAADRNPWMDSPGGSAKDISLFDPDGGKEAIQIGNAVAHQEDAQNVLFLDIHVSQEKRPFCGINDDNIYTYWDGGDIRRGAMPTIGSEPQDRLDSLLVHDGGGGGSVPDPRPKGRPCFIADTPVWVDGTIVQISEAVTGQMVGTPNSVLAMACSSQIEKVDEHDGAFECRDVVLENGNCISVVAAHCFMLDSGRWIAAPDLTSGLKLKSLNGPIRIRSVVKRATPFVGKVYNLKVKNSEQYLVGKDGIVVRDW